MTNWWQIILYMCTREGAMDEGNKVLNDEQFAQGLIDFAFRGKARSRQKSSNSVPQQPGSFHWCL